MALVLRCAGSGESLVDHPIPDAQPHIRFDENEDASAEAAPPDLQGCYDRAESRNGLKLPRLLFQKTA